MRRASFMSSIGLRIRAVLAPMEDEDLAIVAGLAALFAVLAVAASLSLHRERSKDAD